MMTVEALQQALNAEPDRAELRIRLGDALLEAGHPEQALACFEACSPEDDSPPMDALGRAALFGRAAANQRLGRFPSAQILYERLLAADPQAEEALSNLIAMHVERFDLSRVEYYSRRLLEIDPRSAIACQGLALVEVERREYPAAMYWLSRIAECDPPPEGIDAIEYRLSPKVQARLAQASLLKA